MRKRPTAAEKALRDALRKQSRGRYRWISQAVIGGYIADLYCASARVVVEADGSSHNGREKQDQSRDAIFRDKFKLIVLRFTNEEILAAPDSVAQKVLRFCDAAPSKRKCK